MNIKSLIITLSCLVICSSGAMASDKESNYKLLEGLRSQVEELVSNASAEDKAKAESAKKIIDNAYEACSATSKETDEYCDIQTKEAQGAFQLAKGQEAPAAVPASGKPEAKKEAPAEEPASAASGSDGSSTHEAVATKMLTYTGDGPVECNPEPNEPKPGSPEYKLYQQKVKNCARIQELVRFRIAKTNELGESILTPKFAVKWNAFDKALKDILAENCKEPDDVTKDATDYLAQGSCSKSITNAEQLKAQVIKLKN